LFFTWVFHCPRGVGSRRVAWKTGSSLRNGKLVLEFEAGRITHAADATSYYNTAPNAIGLHDFTTTTTAAAAATATTTKKKKKIGSTRARPRDFFTLFKTEKERKRKRARGFN